jgi:hydroxypyruvate reductase
MRFNTLTQMREDAKSLFTAGIHAVDAYDRTKQSVHIDSEKLIVRDIFSHEAISDLSRFQRILLTGFGKVAASMAQATEELLRDRITDGVIIASKGRHPTLARSKLIEAAHPLPDENSLRGAKRLAALVSSAGEKDLILCLISGGGSALCTLPQDRITVEDLRTLTRQLLGCGASIEEINTIRKHLSQIKGGQLARLAYPATVISLIISDVIGDRIDSIASGPFAPDATTFVDAYGIMEKYALTKSIPPTVRDHIEAGLKGAAPETLKQGDPVFQNTSNLIIANNLLALRAIEHRAQQIGYSTLMLTSKLRGDTREAARIFGAMTKTLCEKIKDKANICLIAGGEMTVRLTGKSRGGRNCDFGLALAPLIKGMEKTVVLSAGTDGIDGSTDAAGAIIDGTTLPRLHDLGLDHQSALINHGAYSILKKSGDLLMTGPTNTNVMDIQLVLIRR